MFTLLVGSIKKQLTSITTASSIVGQVGALEMSKALGCLENAFRKRVDVRDHIAIEVIRSVVNLGSRVISHGYLYINPFRGHLTLLLNRASLQSTRPYSRGQHPLFQSPDVFASTTS